MPVDYFPTTHRLSRDTDQCEDTDGSTFRSHWTEDCEYYCPPGQGTDCAKNGDVANLPQRCFYELALRPLTRRDREGQPLPQAGFSRGNFNYRFDQVAVNLVGTAVKNCEKAAPSLPATQVASCSTRCSSTRPSAFATTKETW